MRLLLACAAGMAPGAAPAEECAPAPEPAGQVESLKLAPRPAAAGRAGRVDDEICLIADDRERPALAVSGLAWIDVRPPATVRRDPLQGVLEIPLDDLPAKSFLHNERIVLVGSGFDRAALLDACHRLRAAGWRDVRVLAGGARRWHGAASSAERDELSAEDFFRGAAENPWRVVAVGLDDAALREMPLRPSAVLGFDPRTPARLAEALAAQRRAEGAAGHSDVLVVAPDREAVRHLKNALRQGGFAGNALWLEGGWASFRQYLERQQRIASGAGRVLARPCGAL